MVMKDRDSNNSVVGVVDNNFNKDSKNLDSNLEILDSYLDLVVYFNKDYSNKDYFDMDCFIKEDILVDLEINYYLVNLDKGCLGENYFS